MQRRLRILDVIALTMDLPEHGLVSGHVGTLVEQLDEETFEVEFSDEEGRTYAQVPLTIDHMMALHYRPLRAA